MSEGASSPSDASSSLSSPKSTPPVVIDEATFTNMEDPDVKEQLLDRISPDFGLIDKLVANKALARRELKIIEKKDTPYDKNEYLLELMTRTTKLLELFTALRDCHQEHLINYVNEKGEFKEEYLGRWPLKERETDILTVNRESLIELLNADTELVTKLFQVKVINKRQRDFISQQQFDYKKNEALLDILHCGSMDDYMLTIVCLKATMQDHVADILMNGGVLVSVHNEINGNPDAVTEAETRIIERIENILREQRDNPNVDTRRVFETLQWRLFAAAKGKSVVLYILIINLDELLSLYNVKDEELKKRIEKFFSLLVTRRETFDVKVRLPVEKFNEYKRFLQADNRNEKVSGEKYLKQFQQMTYDDIKLFKGSGEAEDEDEPEDKEEEETEEEEEEEVDEPVKEVEEAAALGLLEEEEMYREADAEKLERTPAAKTEFEKMAAVMRNNFDFLVESMNPRGLIDRLHAIECLTDEETRYIKTQKNDMDKNDEILKVIRNLGPDEYNVFVGILHERGQNIVAEVAEKGGGVIKTTVTFERQRNVEGNLKKLVERINHLQEKTGPRKKEIIQFLALLRRGNMEILRSKYETDLIIWLWCRSQKALKTLDTMNESDDEELSQLLAAFFQVLLDHGDQLPKIECVDPDDPDRFLVCRVSDLSLDTTVATSQHSVCGVTSFESKIYVLSQKPCSILIFQLQNLSKPSKEIPLQDVKKPVDITASSDCVYVSDAGNSCIWEITLSNNKVKQCIQGIVEPYTLSQTQSGQIITVAWNQPTRLVIYDTKTRAKVHDIPLPESIRTPRHAVETPAGTFVISYGDDYQKHSAVCEITPTGDVINVFDSNIKIVEGVGDDINRILARLPGDGAIVGCPYYLTLDERGQVYATDLVNGGVLVFDSRLKLEEVIEKDSIKSPMHLHYLKNRKQMMVVHGAEASEVRILQQKKT